MITETLKRIIRYDVIKVFSAIGLLNVLKMGSSLMANKMVSLYLGPSGMAMLGQLWNFSNIIQAISSGGINPGVTKYVAEYHKNEFLLKKLLSTSIMIITINTLMISILLAIFNKQISNSIFNTSSYSVIIILFSITLLFFNYNNYFIAIINGFSKYKQYVKYNLVTNITNTGLTIVLIFFFGIMGAFTSVVIGGSLIFIYFVVTLKNEYWFGNIYKGISLYKDTLKILLKYSLMTLVSAIVNPLSLIIIRSYIIKESSLYYAGIWESINKLSSFYLMVITNTLLVYFIPKISSIEHRFVGNEVNKFIKIVVPIVIILQTMIFIFRYQIIPFLFSDKFIIICEYQHLQLLGDFFKVLTYIYSYLFVARAMMIPFITTEIVFNIIIVVMTMVGLKIFEFNGLFWGYFLSYAINFIIILCYSYIKIYKQK